MDIKKIVTQYNVKSFEKSASPVEDIKAVFKECNWWTVSDQEFEKLCINSSAVFLAYKGTTPVGAGRIISDGVFYALFVDIMVIPSEQKNGLGKSITLEMINYCKKEGIRGAKLISSTEGKALYEKLGFKVRSDKEPGMILRISDFEQYR